MKGHSTPLLNAAGHGIFARPNSVRCGCFFGTHGVAMQIPMGWQWQAWTFIEWLRLDLGVFSLVKGGVGVPLIGYEKSVMVTWLVRKMDFSHGIFMVGSIAVFFFHVGKRQTICFDWCYEYMYIYIYRTCMRIRMFYPFFPGLLVRNRLIRCFQAMPGEMPDTPESAPESAQASPSSLEEP